MKYLPHKGARFIGAVPAGDCTSSQSNEGTAIAYTLCRRTSAINNRCVGIHMDHRFEVDRTTQRRIYSVLGGKVVAFKSGSPDQHFSQRVYFPLANSRLRNFWIQIHHQNTLSSLTYGATKKCFSRTSPNSLQSQRHATRRFDSLPR